jgi:CubicO group peptidase (beta-lactamase class C family)
VSEYINFIRDIPLDFEPGTNMQHSNIGFEVAGAIIEKGSGENYFDYVKKNIYEPANMLNTDSYHLDGPVENLAVGYTNEHPLDTLKNGYNWNNMYIRLPARGTPTGGSYSTVEDLLKFDQAQRKYKFLSKDYTIYLLNLFQGKPGDEFMGKKGIIHMVGGAEGVGAVLGLDMMDNDMSKGYTIIILSNYDFPVAIDVYTKLKEFIYELKSK